MHEVNSVSFRSKADLVEEYLRRKIAAGEIRAGQRLQQDMVARELGVSSTPVREALRRLETEGMLTYIPHKGVTVREVEAGRVHEVFMLRSVLEGLSAKEAASRISKDDLGALADLHNEMREYAHVENPQAFAAANDQWHMIVHRASGSELLRQTITHLWRLSPWDTLWVVPGRLKAAVAEHEEILKALKVRNESAAGQTMTKHIRNGERALLRFLADQARQRDE